MKSARRGAARLMDGDLCVAFAVVIVGRREGWTAEDGPVIGPSRPLPLSQNNSICIHQSCICHSCDVLPGAVPSMLCSGRFDSPHSELV